jgi:hypothetical protein
MHIAMSNTLALIGWHDIPPFLGDVMGGGAVWLLMGFLSAIVALSALAAEVAMVLRDPHRPQSYARLPVDVSESTVTVSSSRANLDDSGERT